MVPFLLQAWWHIDSTYPIPIATSQYPTSNTTPYILLQAFLLSGLAKAAAGSPTPGPTVLARGNYIHGAGQMPHLIPSKEDQPSIWKAPGGPPAAQTSPNQEKPQPANPDLCKISRRKNNCKLTTNQDDSNDIRETVTQQVASST